MSFLELCVPLRESGDETPLPDFGIQESGGYYIVGSLQKPIAKIKKRRAYPQTYCDQIDQNTIMLGYGPVNPQTHDEFLQIIIDSKSSVAIRRDTYATLPLFYGKSDRAFVLSNDYSIVVSGLHGLMIDHAMLLETLIPNPDKHATLWSEVSLLDERHELELKTASKLLIRPPEPRAWGSSAEAGRSDPKRFKDIFAVHLDSFISKFSDQRNFAFEVSGGLDSATLPLYCTSTGQQRDDAVLGAMIFPGEFGITQKSKLATLASLTGMPLVQANIDPETDYPLARIMRGGRTSPFYCFEEIYAECLEKLAANLAERNVQLVATGVGGDELFENTLSAEHQLLYGAAERRSRSQSAYPPFFTDAMLEEYKRLTPDAAPYPMPLLAVSLQGAQIARNNIYIAHDIWPVSPFADVELYRFCQGLPAHFRANKNILRTFHAAYDFPSEIYHPKQNEHFGEFFDVALTSGRYDQLIQCLRIDSVTSQLGYVDTDKLAEAYKACQQSPIAPEKRWLLHVYAWLCVEVNLQPNNRL